MDVCVCVCGEGYILRNTVDLPQSQHHLLRIRRILDQLKGDSYSVFPQNSLRAADRVFTLIKS